MGKMKLTPEQEAHVAATTRAMIADPIGEFKKVPRTKTDLHDWTGSPQFHLDADKSDLRRK